MIGELSASFEQPARHVHAGVGEREQRHDHVAGPRVQAVLEALVGRDRRRSRPAAPSAPARAWAARETSAPARSRARGPRATAGRRSSRARSRAPRSPGRCPTRTSRPTGRRATATDTGRSHCGARARAASSTPNSATAIASARTETCVGVDDRDHEQRARDRRPPPASAGTRAGAWPQRGVSSASAPSAKAVSVDIAAPQPCAPGPPALNAR